MTRVGVAVPAAGAGRRMGGVRKPFMHLAGEPVLMHALRALLGDPRVVSVVVALGSDDAMDPPAWLVALDPRISVVQGGDSRTDSVRAALAALPDALDVIAVHDAARPLVTIDVVSRCIDVAESGVGAVAGCPVVDTLKEVGSDGTIVDTPDRTRFWRAHTPQVFPAAMLRHAYANAAEEATDDAALVERAGGKVRLVDDGTSNLKLTRAEDLKVAEAILRGRRERKR
ncbi:MAG: 2-C-methyl-D-erythritol 4-phosphate cytidylyltransferase [Gemmatimonadetes bacterium]|nr:2-C-methyl-D-erythritol 4-phosphate cytidylyltransferase [Gemmatimonadota bacterium]